MLTSFEVKGLNRTRDYKILFHKDVNIITGTNGAGKTNLIKLLWYMLSGNLERILPEISFKSARLATDSMSLKIENTTSTTPSENPNSISITINTPEGTKKHKANYTSLDEASDWLNEFNGEVIKHTGSSIFFPTFRRIEGGFSLRTPRAIRRYGLENPDGGINEVFRSYANQMSVSNHKFVTTVSADDMVRIVTSKYAEASAETNRLHLELSEYIIKTTNKHSGSSTAATNPSSSLEKIRIKADAIRLKQEHVLKPFSVISSAVSSIFQHPGIRMTESIVFGNSEGCVNVDLLSAGEKQMLGFLCYNTLFRDSVFCIDEPELSLHPDWQRILIQTLIDQKNGNQIIATTHSPFIIGRYPDKEVRLIPDTGDKL